MSEGREERSDDRKLLKYNNEEARSDDNAPPISLQKEPLARHFAPPHRYTPPVNYLSTITNNLPLVALLIVECPT